MVGIFGWGSENEIVCWNQGLNKNPRFITKYKWVEGIKDGLKKLWNVGRTLRLCRREQMKEGSENFRLRKW